MVKVKMSNQKGKADDTDDGSRTEADWSRGLTVLCLEMAGAMMVERAHNLPSMAFTDPKEYLAKMAEEATEMKMFSDSHNAVSSCINTMSPTQSQRKSLRVFLAR